MNQVDARPYLEAALASAPEATRTRAALLSEATFQGFSPRPSPPGRSLDSQEACERWEAAPKHQLTLSFVWQGQTEELSLYAHEADDATLEEARQALAGDLVAWIRSRP